MSCAVRIFSRDERRETEMLECFWEQIAVKLRCPVSKFIAHTISHVFFLALLAFATSFAVQSASSSRTPSHTCSSWHCLPSPRSALVKSWVMYCSPTTTMTITSTMTRKADFGRSFRVNYFHLSNATMSCTNSKRGFDIRNLPSTHSTTSSSSGFSVSFVLPNIVEETILLTPPTSGLIACNQLKLAPPGRWRETLHVYSVVVCVDNRS